MITRILLFGLVVLAGLVVSLAPSGARLDDASIAVVGFSVYAAVGGLIIFRRNGHLTGWLLLLTGLAVVSASELPFFPGMSEFASAWVASGGWGVVFSLFAALTLTFPSGHAPVGDGFYARLGRFALWSLPFLVFITFFTETLGGPEGAASIENPYGLLPDAMSYPALISIVLIILGGAISLVVRRRRSQGEQRAQLTWVVFGLVLFVTAVLVSFVYIFIYQAVVGSDPGDSAWTVVFIMMMLFPLTFGIAILRCRLYDIDRIVSRTVAYTGLAGLLALTYFAAVTVLSSQLRLGNELAVAAATLLAAALFNPLRLRLQRMVDRRFNRSRYDAQMVADNFARTVQDNVGDGRITTDFLAVVSETMQPSALAVWVRGEPVGDTSS